MDALNMGSNDCLLPVAIDTRESFEASLALWIDLGAVLFRNWIDLCRARFEKLSPILDQWYLHLQESPGGVQYLNYMSRPRWPAPSIGRGMPKAYSGA